MVRPEDKRAAGQVRLSPLSWPQEPQTEQQEKSGHRGNPNPLRHHLRHGNVLEELEPPAAIAPSMVRSMHDQAVDGSVMPTCEQRGRVVAATERVSPGWDASLHEAEGLGCKQRLQRWQLWALIKALTIVAVLEAAMMLVIAQGQVRVYVCDYLLSPFQSLRCCMFTAAVCTSSSGLQRPYHTISDFRTFVQVMNRWSTPVARRVVCERRKSPQML